MKKILDLVESFSLSVGFAMIFLWASTAFIQDHPEVLQWLQAYSIYAGCSLVGFSLAAARLEKIREQTLPDSSGRIGFYIALSGAACFLLGLIMAFLWPPFGADKLATFMTSGFCLLGISAFLYGDIAVRSQVKLGGNLV
jgi:hypothetical protein